MKKRELEGESRARGMRRIWEKSDVEDVDRRAGEIPGEHGGDSCFEVSEEKPKEEGFISKNGAGKDECAREGEGDGQARGFLP